MKKLGIVILLVVLLLVQTFAVSALSAEDAKQVWKDAKEYSKEMQEAHREAKAKFAGDNSESNKQDVIDTGKETMHAALDEVEAWLLWKEAEVDENYDVSEDLRDEILEDIDENLGKVDALRDDVDGIETRAQMGLVFLKMVGKYGELLTDVARNSGKVWANIANDKADTVEAYEAKLREAAEGLDDNDDMISELDDAKQELEQARENIQNANKAYGEVVRPGTPLIKFAEGNNYLRNARLNLIAAHGHLNQAYVKMTVGGSQDE